MNEEVKQEYLNLQEEIQTNTGWIFPGNLFK